VIVNSDLREEGPMMLLAVREAWRNGSPVFLVGDHSPLDQVRVVSVEAIQLSIPEEVPLGIFENAVVICGTRHNTPDAIENLARAEAKLACLTSGPNACGAAILAREHETASLAEAVAAGTVKGVVAVEADIPPELLDALPLVVALDRLPTDLVKRADIVFPTTAWVEMDGTYVNFEGRAQRFRKAMAPGFPIKGLPARFHASADKPAPFHPPRVHRKEPPGGDLRPAWRVIGDIIERLGGERIEEPLAGRWEKLRDLCPEGEGERVI